MVQGSSKPLSAAMMPAPVVVVGQQFCAPNEVKLTMTKNDDFVVTDVNGSVLMKVQCHFFSLRKRRVLHNAAGTPIISMKKKLLTMHSRWNVFRGDSSDPKDLLFTVKRSRIVQFRCKTKLDVFLVGNMAEESCDFQIKESWFHRSCTFCLGNTDDIIALMSRKNVLLGKNTFDITIYPNMDYAFVVAIIVILNEINREGSFSGDCCGDGGDDGGGC